MKKIGEREYKYQAVMKELVKRYIMKKQQRDQNAGVTEDDLNEIKQDISGFRFELLEILKNNEYKVDVFKQNPGAYLIHIPRLIYIFCVCSIFFF